jgi:hypothetical protein
MFFGDIPEGLVIDHIDQNRDNNNISNLRMVSKAQNNLNTDRKGVTLDKASGKWIAQTSVGNRNVYLGSYSTRGEAEREYAAFKEYRMQTDET